MTEVDLDDMAYDDGTTSFSWPCRCSDTFVVTESQLEQRFDVFECQTCCLKIRVLYEEPSDEDEGGVND